MGIQDHVAGPIGYSGVWMGCSIVKKLLDLAHGVFCWACLLRCNQSQGGKHRAVNSSLIIKECDAHLLEEFFPALSRRGELYCCSAYCRFAL